MWDNNIYYDPTKYGLEIVGENDEGASYEFDKIVVFKNGSNELFMLHDAGCSCPIPFENKGLNDLIPLRDIDELRRFGENRHYAGPGPNFQNLLNKVRAVL